MLINIVTGNKEKFNQLSQYLPSNQCKQIALDLPEIQTNLLTEISYDKCLQAYVEVQGPVLVDDSGIYFDAFNEFPGALTKFLYDGVGIVGMQKLFQDEKNTKATFQSVLSYMDTSMLEPVQFIGEVMGTINFDRVGKIEENPKIPYDLIFIPEGMNQPAITNMELRKSEFNHRVRAVKKFAEWIGIDK